MRAISAEPPAACCQAKKLPASMGMKWLPRLSLLKSL
jgi:hypothetical protein